jgi:hypothetical protein
VLAALIFAFLIRWCAATPDPDMQIYPFRLSDKSHAFPRHVASKASLVGSTRRPGTCACAMPFGLMFG